MKVPEYRAFLAIEMPIAEVADIPDLVADLQMAKQKILERLTTTQEYRALLTVEKAIKDISEVLDVVGDDATVEAAPAAAEKVAEKEEVSAAAAAEAQQSAPAVAVAAPPAKAPAIVANATAAVQDTPETYARDAADIAAAIASAEHNKKSAANPSERLSTLGHVEEWRLTALVRESYSANAGNEDAGPAGEGKAQAEQAKVA
ncbi:MAG: hypothetical protein WBQ24_00460 [Xanthobacteraceae bacterium]